MAKTYYFTDSRFKYVSFVLVAMWIFFMVYLVQYGKAISSNPCTLCAEKIGDGVTCRVGLINIQEVVFHENGTITAQSGGLAGFNIRNNFTVDNSSE